MNKLDFSTVLCAMLKKIGVEYVFGVSGGAVAHIWYALEQSSIHLIHCKHEAGASFAATEAYFATGRPSVVITTTGPGITNALTGLFAARVEGAKIIFISGHTSIAKRGRYALQEPSEYCADIYTEGVLFNYTILIENATMLPLVLQKLCNGMASPGSFVAHLSIPIEVQTSLLDTGLPDDSISNLNSIITVEDKVIHHCADLLNSDLFSIWLGFGARHASKEIYELAILTGSAVMCTPRGKGIFPEDHPQFVGVTGFSGHESVFSYIEKNKPVCTLVLGSRLSEISSFWDPALLPSKELIHVDVNPSVFGAAYPFAKTLGVQANIKSFVAALMKHLRKKDSVVANFTGVKVNYEVSANETIISPVTLLNAIQKIIVESSDAIIMAEAGNSFAWATHLLRFQEANRFRESSSWGAMGHFVTGVIGAALARHGKAVVIVGDGAMLMNNEINTAVKYRIPAVWIVLNDAHYNMCEQGHAMIKKKIDTNIPRTNFASLANSLGADGIQVKNVADIVPALQQAMQSELPFVVDCFTDPNVIAPIGKRIQSISDQKNVGEK